VVSVTREDIEDLFAPCARVSVRRMFGGHGIYAGAAMVAIEAGGSVYLKADEATRASFEAEGCPPFTYEARGRTNRLGFFRLPEAAWEDPDEMRKWYDLARIAAEKAARPRNSGRRQAKSPA
jgi:DNA transformation protein